MILPSRLSATTLGDLLGMLHRERTTGTLELTELWHTPGTRSGHYVHLRSGLVVDVETPLSKTPPLGEFLRREGFLSNTGYRVLMGHLEKHDRRSTGEILVAERLADAAIVEAALRVQVRMKLDVLFHLTEALVTFHAAGPPKRAARRIHPLTPRDFLVGRPRARDRAPTSEVRPRTRPAVWSEPFYTYERANDASQSRTPPPSSARTTQAKAHHEGPPHVSGRAKPTSTFLHLAPDVRRRALSKLGLPMTADEADVKRAFRKLAVELHPDKHATAPALHRDRSAARFAEVSEAYHLLVA
ncbi:MAG: J domain-containing protein [Polyangiaceae bacterium]|nr:J domain-containing protein [Polyangiaceae bacterium]